MRKIVTMLLVMFAFSAVHDAVFAALDASCTQEVRMCDSQHTFASQKHAVMHDIHTMCHFVALLESEAVSVDDMESVHHYVFSQKLFSALYVDRTVKPPIYL